MVLGRWQATIVDEAGNVQPGAELTVRDEETGTLAALFVDRDGTTPLGNPFNADANGFAFFYVAGSSFRIDAVVGAETQTLRYVPVGTAAEADSEDYESSNSNIVVSSGNLVDDRLIVGDGGGKGVKTISTTSPLPPSDNFNNIVYPGFYRSEDAQANRPADFTAILDFSRSSTRRAQIGATTATSAPKIWWRQVGSTISNWLELLTTGNILDEDNMVSNSAVYPATQQSIKAYVDSLAGGSVIGTAQATTSGTAIDFTGLPAGLKRIQVNLDQVSLSGSDNLLVQLGDSGGVETTGYVSASGNSGTETTSTSGFILFVVNAGASVSGIVTLNRVNGNAWVASHSLDTVSGTSVIFGGGRKTLSATLDRVRLTRSGTNTFDAGQVNIIYE